jgi:predicted GNAT family acetyltransferase
MKQHWSNEHARCEVVTNPELPPEMDRVREVVRVWTEPGSRQQGYATELLKAVCDEADAENLVLILQPSPFGANVSRDRLMTLYKRFGFIRTQDKPVLMARAPTFKVRQTAIAGAVERLHRG